MSLSKQDLAKLLRDSKNNPEAAAKLEDAIKADEKEKAITKERRRDKALLAGMALELGGAAAGGAIVGALKHYNHEDLMIPIAGGMVIFGAYQRTKKADDQLGQGLFAGGSGMIAALVAVETQAKLDAQKAAA